MKGEMKTVISYGIPKYLSIIPAKDFTISPIKLHGE